MSLQRESNSNPPLDFRIAVEALANNDPGMTMEMANRAAEDYALWAINHPSTQGFSKAILTEKGFTDQASLIK